MPEVITKQTTVYTFDELSDTAKDTAHHEWLGIGDYWHWQSEWWDSAKAFSEIAPIDIIEADYDRGHVNVNWTGDSDVADLEGVRAWKWLKNNGWFDWAIDCVKGGTMTGYIGDAPFGDPLIEYSKSPHSVPTVKQVFYECAQAWLSDACSDLGYSQSMEAFEDMCEANEWRFTEEGTFYHD